VVAVAIHHAAVWEHDLCADEAIVGKWISTPPVGRCRCMYAASPVRWIQTVGTTPANPGNGGRST
jgi:hypothetical protein